MTYTIKTQQKMMCMQAEEPAQPQKHERHHQQDVYEHVLSAWKS